MCLRFADMESKLGEIDRARAIYSFCSQMCDPRVSHQSFYSISMFIYRLVLVLNVNSLFTSTLIPLMIVSFF